MTKPIECDGAISDAVLQAARAAMPADADLQSWICFGDCSWIHGAGEKQAPLLALLGCLIDAATAVASAINDNAWDDSKPVPTFTAHALADEAREIGHQLIGASQCPDATAFELPSFTEASALELA